MDLNSFWFPLGIILVPVAVFYSVKLGTYAYLEACRRFRQDYPQEK